MAHEKCPLRGLWYEFPLFLSTKQALSQSVYLGAHYKRGNQLACICVKWHDVEHPCAFLPFCAPFCMFLIGHLQKGSAELGFPWFVLICCEKKSEQIGRNGANRNKSHQIGVFPITRSANWNKSKENGANRNKSGWPPSADPRLGAPVLFLPERPAKPRKFAENCTNVCKKHFRAIPPWIMPLSVSPMYAQYALRIWDWGTERDGGKSAAPRLRESERNRTFANKNERTWAELLSDTTVLWQ